MKHEAAESVIKKVVVRTECDGCGKIEGPDPYGWLNFSSYHHDWGNDSIDSHDRWDVCSFGCYLTVVRRVFEDYGEQRRPTLEIDAKDWWFVRDMLNAVATKVAE